MVSERAAGLRRLRPALQVSASRWR